MTHDQIELETFAESLETLRREQGKKPQPGEPQELPIEDIRFASLVFQPRMFDGNGGDREEHIKNLMNAVRNRPDHKLPPITVWWSGTKWLVLDGHHRMIAYQRLAIDRKKPIKITKVAVEVFNGTLEEAIKEASERNYQDKLNMSKGDKLERAWKLTVIDHPNLSRFSRSVISKSTGIAPQTVANMRKEHRRIMEEMPSVNPLDLTWDEVKKGAREVKDYDDKWIEAQARDFANRLSKTFGHKLSKNPEVAAKAIEIYSEKLPMRLVEYWRDEVMAKVEQWGDEDF